MEKKGYYNKTALKNRIQNFRLCIWVTDMTNGKQQLAKKLFAASGPILKTKTLNENKFCSREIAELVQRGLIQKIKPGYYVWSGDADNLSDIETVAAVIPYGIICRYSAAQLHELTTVNPLVVSIAIPANRTRVAVPSHPPVELVPTSAATFELGLTTLKTGHMAVRVYDRERTVCDFFRKRNQLGEDMALEVLQNYMSGSRNLQRLFEYASKLRIKKVIKPYVEALL